MKLIGKESDKAKKYRLDKEASKKHKRYKKRAFYTFLAFVLIIGTVYMSPHILKTIGNALSKKDLPEDVKIITMFADEDKAASNEVETEESIEEIVNEAIEEYELEEDEEVVEEESQEEKLIKEFCNVYAVDEEKVLNRLKELTDNFSSSEYLENHTIPGVIFKGKPAVFENKSLLLIMAVRCAKQAPKQLGFNEGELDTGIEYISPLDDTHTIAYFAYLMERNPAKDYGVMNAECQLSEGLYKTHNNPGSLRYDGDWWKFSSISEGILETMFEILKYERNGYDTLESMAKKWEGTDNWPVWLKNAEGSYNEAMANYDELFSLEGLKEIVDTPSKSK